MEQYENHSNYPDYPRKLKTQVRLDLVAKYFRRGYSHKAIIEFLAKNHGVIIRHENQIKEDIQDIIKEWQERRVKNADSLMIVEIEKITEINQELWHAWQRSKENAVLKNTKRKGAPIKAKDNSKVEIKQYYSEEGTKEEINFGDPRFMQLISENWKEYRKLLGLYSADKKSLDITNIDLSTISKDEMDMMAKLALKLNN